VEIKLEITFDPSQNPPLKVFTPHVNPALIVSILSQAITGVCHGQIAGESNLIVPPVLVPKIWKNRK
jgi:hypothetical protein